jgi:hypothetical protein
MPIEDDLEEVVTFLRRWNSLPNKQATRLAPEIPIAAMQVGAVRHPDRVAHVRARPARSGSD